jgi:PAS domain-containing protein
MRGFAHPSGPALAALAAQAATLAAGSTPAHAAEGTATMAGVAWGVAGVLAGALTGAVVALLRGRRILGLFQDSFDSVPQPQQMVARDGTPLRTNAAFRAYFAGEQGAMAEVLARRAVGQEAGDELRRLAERAAAGGRGRAEVPVCSGGGERLWLDVRAEPMRERPGLVFWSAEDITARRQMQDVREDEQARFIDQARLGILGVLPEYRQRGLELVLIHEIAVRGRDAGYYEGELSWILEDNDGINKPIAALGADLYKTYRLYQKSI